MICTFISENVNLIFVFVVLTSFTFFKLNSEQSVPLRFITYLVFHSSNCKKRIIFQFVAIVVAEGQVLVGSQEHETGQTGKMMKHSTTMHMLKTFGRDDRLAQGWALGKLFA